MTTDNQPATPDNETETPAAESKERTRRATIRAAVLSVPLVLTLTTSASAQTMSGMYATKVSGMSMK